MLSYHVARIKYHDNKTEEEHKTVLLFCFYIHLNLLSCYVLRNKCYALNPPGKG